MITWDEDQNMTDKQITSWVDYGHLCKVLEARAGEDYTRLFDLAWGIVVGYLIGTACTLVWLAFTGAA